MSRIILIETSTSLCSTALVEDGKVVCERISDEPRAHASKTALFVSEMLSEKGLKVSDCDAVAVSKGPGSYTGLRVGVSTAKGLCFGAGIPMISVGTLDTLVWQALDGNMLPEGCRYIIPMIDARRMEVYTGIFTPDGKQISPTVAQIIDADSFKDQLAEGPVLFIGDDKTQVGKNHVLLHEGMGADKDIDGPFFQALQDFIPFLRLCLPRKIGHMDRKALIKFLECPVMLGS